jgi:signal transduction histidine kinase
MRLDIYTHKNQWKIVLLIVAVLIAIATLWYTETFLRDLRAEEMKRAEIWARAVQLLAEAPEDAQLLFALEVVEKNTTIPIIMTDGENNIVTHRNVSLRRKGQEEQLQQELRRMMSEHDPIVITLGAGEVNYIYYRDSVLLNKLRIYPMVLLGVIALFILIAYMAFSNVRRSEQNRVWTGMAKETAHQIGTPLSSLMGWIEILRGNGVEESVLVEMEKDIDRLLVITERFSKIGSQPQLTPTDIASVTAQGLEYLTRRSSNRITLDFENKLAYAAVIPLNAQLYGWVIENLVRNAIDAIEGKGSIRVCIRETTNNIQIDVSDTGKGISPAMTKAIFRPGFTSKTRGWGLGLSLAKRIVEEYHNGKIYVHKTEPGKGTTFRISLPKIQL